MPPKSSKPEEPFALNARSEAEWENSPAAQALSVLQANPRVKYIIIAAPEDACTACQQLTGTYAKDSVPRLPIGECSHPLGCRAFYMPYLDDIYP
jgi:hypothetical protein